MISESGDTEHAMTKKKHSREQEQERNCKFEENNCIAFQASAMSNSIEKYKIE